MNLTINGGTGTYKYSAGLRDALLTLGIGDTLNIAFAASVFLNNHFLNSSVGIAGVQQTTAVYDFPNGTVNLGGDNVITVVQVSPSISCPIPPSLWSFYFHRLRLYFASTY